MLGAGTEVAFFVYLPNESRCLAVLMLILSASVTACLYSVLPDSSILGLFPVPVILNL